MLVSNGSTANFSAALLQGSGHNVIDVEGKSTVDVNHVSAGALIEVLNGTLVDRNDNGAGNRMQFLGTIGEGLLSSR